MSASNLSEKSIDLTPPGQSHTIRLWLLALLVLTAIVAGGVLFVKYQLEVLRTTVQAEIETRTGILLNAESIRVDGLRGLRMRQLQMTIETESGPTLDAFVPEALLRVNIVDLLQGRVSLRRIQLDNARIRLVRPPGNYWFTSDLTERSALKNPIPFRAVGRNCSIEIEGIVGDTSFRIDNLNFDLNRLADSPHLIANLDGEMDETDKSSFQLFARYSSLENFDLRMQGDALDTHSLMPFFPLFAGHIASGTTQPSIRIAGYPRSTMVVSLELPFENLTLQEQHDFPVPSEGILTALASYDMSTHLLTLNTAKTLSPEFEGQVEGTISFAQDPPELDLKLEIEHFAMDDIMKIAADAGLQRYGTLALDASDPYLFFLTFSGSTTNTQVGLEAQLGAGSLHFIPAADSLPEANLQFSLMSLSWHSGTSLPTGRLSLSDGTISHGPGGIHADNVSGTLVLSDSKIAFAPLVAQVAGNTIRGSLAYALESETLSLDLSGDLAAIEELGAIRDHPLLAMRGPISINALSGTITPDKYEIDTMLDLTRTQIDWDWWFSKKPGVGARIQEFHVEAVAKKSAHVTVQLALDTARIDASISLTHTGEKWELQNIDAQSPRLEMGTIDKVLNVPYTISGGEGNDAWLRWERKSSAPEKLELTTGGIIDDLALLPDGTNIPIAGTNVSIEALILKEDEVRTGTLTLHTTTTSLPPFGSPWLLPLRAEDDPSRTRFPPLNRPWTYTLQADTLSYPPWSGADFTATAFSTKSESGFKSFRAVVEEGSVSGMYSSTRPDNMHHLDATWEKVPATYLLEHLKLPAIFTGTMTGGIAYELDKDDSGTLVGTGYFDVIDGQFSADYLFAQFERQIEEESITLPPSMKFSRFSADITLEGDIVKTTNMVLESDAVKISGGGQFVVDGDMDYRLRFALPPATAKGIPTLKAYFNLDGLKHRQSDLELTFRIHGPSFAPKMELEGLPSVGDTLVSGAVEVTSDVIKAVDLPRQILLDLFKIGGGIVGAGTKKGPSR